MSVQKRHAVVVQATLTVLVARDAAGDMVDGVRTRLERIDGVDGVGDLDVSGVRPGLNDLQVEVATELRLESLPPDEADDPDAAAEALADGFGVKRAVVTDVR
jgi:Co/Zn/Cd efflux system component